MIKPKFEFQCIRESDKIYFILKNVSPLSISNIKLESFILQDHDGKENNIILWNNSFPTSIGTQETVKFDYEHSFLKQRPIGAREFICVFSMEDEYDNVFKCVAKKDVSNCKVDGALGRWETIVSVEEENENEKDEDEEKMKTKIFISHRSWDKEYAEAIVDFMENLGVESESIVCTSVADHIIPNGRKIYDWLREQFLEYKLHMVFLLSDNYYKSPDCLNEMGAAWVTKADSDVVLLPGFNPDKIEGCIGKDTMAIYFDGPNDILLDRIKQLRDKVCLEFGLNKPGDRRWENIRGDLIAKIKSRESKTESEDDIRQPIFDVKITDVNHSLPNMVEVIDLWGRQHGANSKHKNVQMQIILCNDVTIRNLKVFGQFVDTVAKKDKPYPFAICYLESPDARNRKHVWVLSRENYPAGEDGYPKIVTIEYCIDNTQYKQTFGINNDHVYMPIQTEVVEEKKLEKIISLKNKMKEDFYRPISELKQYTTAQLWADPSKKLVRSKTIIMATDCQDPKWNTDGKYGEYEMLDFCDAGLLLWDYTSAGVEVTYYQGDELMTTKAHRLWCLLFEDVVAYDMKGNESYNEPIIYVENRPGKKQFRKDYYWDDETHNYIDNGMIVEVKEIQLHIER